MIHANGYTAIKGIRNFENTRIPLALGSFKPLDGLIASFLGRCARYMVTPRATATGVAEVARECHMEMQWGLIVMHLDCLEEVVHPT